MNCPGCGVEFASTEPIDDTESHMGASFHDIGAIYYCQNCGDTYRYVHNPTKGMPKMRKLGEDPSEYHKRTGILPMRSYDDYANELGQCPLCGEYMHESKRSKHLRTCEIEHGIVRRR